jgi:hypothetical protein
MLEWKHLFFMFFIGSVILLFDGLDTMQIKKVPCV